MLLGAQGSKTEVCVCPGAHVAGSAQNRIRPAGTVCKPPNSGLKEQGANHVIIQMESDVD